MKALLVALAAAAGLTWMATSISHDGMDANSGRQHSVESLAKKSSSARSDSGDEKNRDGGMRGTGMMNGMMSMMGGMMSGGGMMNGCPMMNNDRPNDQWNPATPGR